ncbi:MAG: hypothetical protein VX278_09120, partial [Myxococcota bacterium]|nr:hypothetical protein [Myxococcota bacterium]
MDIKRLVSWAYSVDEIPDQIQRNTIARQRYIEKNIPEDTLELSEKIYVIGQGRFLSYQIGGIVGPLSTLMSQDRSLSAQERIRVCSIACEAASRVGLAFEFTPLRQSYTALTEAIFTIALAEKKDRQTVETALEHSFSLACVGDWSLYPGMLMRACFSLAEQLFRAPLASSFGMLPPASLPISSLYQNHTWVGATQVLSAHPVPLVLQTAVQSVNEVLQRHLKAAGKRLRMDQVQEIRLFMPTVNPVFLRGDVSMSSQAIGLS